MNAKINTSKPYNIFFIFLLAQFMLYASFKPKCIIVEDNTDMYLLRPILDSTLLCSLIETWWGDYEIVFFYRVEKMPKPKIPIFEIENILKKNIKFNNQELSYNDTIYFQCIVNCMGRAGDFQIVKCPVEFINICCQVLDVLRVSLIEWEHPIQRDQNVDLLSLIKVRVNKGQFKIIAPHY